MKSKTVNVMNAAYRKDILQKEKLKSIEMHSFLKAYNVSVPLKEEFDFYKLELLYESIVQKEQFEDIFYNNYIDMYDYWNTISYQEKKQQMQHDLDILLASLNSFVFEDTNIYIPVLSAERNLFYQERLVMLQFKNHAKVVRHFDEEVSYDFYGSIPYKNGFTSLEFILESNSHYVLYSRTYNVLFCIDDEAICTCRMFLPVTLKDPVMIQTIAEYILHEDENGLCEYLCLLPEISSRVKRKLK